MWLRPVRPAAATRLAKHNTNNPTDRKSVDSMLPTAYTGNSILKVIFINGTDVVRPSAAMRGKGARKMKNILNVVIILMLIGIGQRAYAQNYGAAIRNATQTMRTAT